MAVRIRTDGRVLCAAMHPEEPGDLYLDDNVHYHLSAEVGVLVTEAMFHGIRGNGGGHNEHGEWWWSHRVPEDVALEPRP